MKKSNYINLVLLTVSLAATAKTRENALFNPEAVNYTELESTSNNINSVSPGEVKYEGPFSRLRSVIRGGFGQDQHSGAEQHHDEKKQD